MNVETDPAKLSEQLTGAQFDLYAFISVLMRGASEASDVLQETNLTILRHPENYDPSRPFMPWARGVARKCILKFYSERSREKVVVFDNEMMESLAEEVPCATDARPLEELDRLRKCLAKLLPRQREIITARYMRGESVKAIAAREKSSEGAVSVLLYRLRQQLAELMEKERGKACL